MVQRNREVLYQYGTSCGTCPKYWQYTTDVDIIKRPSLFKKDDEPHQT